MANILRLRLMLLVIKICLTTAEFNFHVKFSSFTKHLQNFDHPLNHFVSTSKKSIRNDTVQKFYQGLKIFEHRNFFYFFLIFAKNSKFCNKDKMKFFSTKTRQFPSLGREFFSVPYRRSIDLEILQVISKYLPTFDQVRISWCNLFCYFVGTLTNWCRTNQHLRRCCLMLNHIVT